MLRSQMIEEMQLRGYAQSTIEGYVHAVAQLARHYHRAPDKLTEDEVRRYLLHLKLDKKIARGFFSVVLGGLRFFYQKALGRDWKSLYIAKPRSEKKLPVVLSRDEVWSVLDVVRIDVYRVCLTTIYACGLRLMEGASLQIPNVDSAAAFFTSRASGARTARCRCPTPLSNCCETTGARIARPSGSFLPPPDTASNTPSPMTADRSLATVCKALSVTPSRGAV